MRLLRIGPMGEERPAAITEAGKVVDLGPHLSDYNQDFWEQGGFALVDRLVREIDELRLVDIERERIGPPIAKPYQVLCIGVNYAEHARESGLALPDEPVVFNKGPATVVGPYDDVLIPPTGTKVDWEVELAVVVGAPARYLPSVSAARSCIGGYAISNDISERAFQLERGGQWVKGKSCETFNPLGPWLISPDAIADVQQLQLRLDVNGECMQNGTTADMVFGVEYLVWYLSQFMVLEPGDLINTGTPAGVGLGRNPPQYLSEGDIMTVRIDGLGEQRQHVRQATV